MTGSGDQWSSVKSSGQVITPEMTSATFWIWKDYTSSDLFFNFPGHHKLSTQVQPQPSNCWYQIKRKQCMNTLPPHTHCKQLQALTSTGIFLPTPGDLMLSTNSISRVSKGQSDCLKFDNWNLIELGIWIKKDLIMALVDLKHLSRAMSFK